MNPSATTISQRLSLRKPLREALGVVAELAAALPLTKDADLGAALATVQDKHPHVQAFDRDFVSLCLSIATGVGKTRLMGACMAYLHQQHGIRNFFVLAPNLTIYNKLIEDFGNPANPKYVFNGLSEFVHNRPVVITGENYAQQGGLFQEREVRINVFNIAKFNSDSKATKAGGRSHPPRIKRLSEYLGQSYWQYLTSLNDLVILMDEAHRYRAGASRAAINELKPVLGLELTATPIDNEGEPFRNVVYEYTLARALEDGLYVKNPAIATRRNFDPKGLTTEEIEQIKLEDAISLHEDTRTALELYAARSGQRMVKPFMLVVCRDITHARATYEYVSSDKFFNGAYRGKVLQIDSSTRTEDAVEQDFLTLEHPDNRIEIVIHVAMLKEGWDVTNLYTIVPLNAANAPILIEQTIGRGLRLPYGGQRTNDTKVDKLTVVAHDNFQRVIEAAKDPNSVLNKLSYVEIPEDDLRVKTVVVTAPSKTEAALVQEQARVAAISNPQQQQQAQNVLDAQKAILNVLPTLNAAAGVTGVADLSKPEVKARVLDQVKAQQTTGQLNVFADNIVQEAAGIYDRVVASYRENIIEIPRIDLVLDDVRTWFEEFDLDVQTGFDLQPLPDEVTIHGLVDSTVTTVGVRHGAYTGRHPANQLVVELLNYPEVDYDDNADLLHKLTTQAITALEQNLTDKAKLPVVLRQHGRLVAKRIHDQLKNKFRVAEPTYQEPKVLPFSAIVDWKFSALANGGYKDYREIVTPVGAIPRYIFRGFAKAGHFEYKFDSKPEKDFAQMLEQDADVLKWLRPAPSQFRIYWAHNSRLYEPDFVVETADTIYLVEVKAGGEIGTEEVQDKRRGALAYCRHASTYTAAHSGKPWRYLLIPAEEVDLTHSLAYYATAYVQREQPQAAVVEGAEMPTA